MLMVLAFIVALALLIVIHEFGHYQVAKWCGVKVLRFSIGFGKPLFARRLGQDQTQFMVAAIPMGGYVQMLDERELDADELKQHALELHRAFNRQSVYKRIAIVAAGPIANLLLAILLYWGLISQGVSGFVAKIAQPAPNTPAQIAGFQGGQKIIKVAGKPVDSWQDFQWQLLQLLPSQQPILIQVQQNDQQVQQLQLNASDLSADQMDENLMQQLGFQILQPDIPAVIGIIQEGSVAQKVGLQINDKVLAINGNAIDSWGQLVERVHAMPGQKVQLQVLREGRTIDVAATLQAVNEHGQTSGKLGIGPQVDEASMKSMLVTKQLGIFPALQEAVKKTWQTSIFSLKMLFKMITGQASLKSISGPVTIASYAGQSAHMGLKPYIAFLAILSISLGVLNLLPIPILDGGHLMYYTAEIIRGRPLSDAWMVAGQKVGFVILGALMIIALFNDFSRLMTGS